MMSVPKFVPPSPGPSNQSNTPELDTKLLPRAYQEEIFSRAQTGNVIAVLDTGSGKTFIAALLIKWLTSQPELSDKKVMFLVPKVPLVDQQRNFLAKQTPLEVRGYVGAMNVDKWDKARWRLEFQRADVLIMTPQIFRDLLSRSYWNMGQLSLLVFDECHHARGNHMYNQIMRDYYARCPIRDRPTIFGMTASPVWNVKNPAAALQELRFNLFASIVAVKDHVDELAQHAPKPVEIVERYRPSPLSYPAYEMGVKSLFKEVERISSTWTHGSLDLDSAKIRHNVTLNSLGPYGADYFLYKHLTSALESLRGFIFSDTRPLIYGEGVTQIFNEVDSATISDRNNKLHAELISALSHFNINFLHEDLELSPGWLSPKVQETIRILQEHKSPTFHCIIFVEQRQIASALSWLLMRHPSTKGWVRSAVITGHGGVSGTDAVGMTDRGQKLVVKKFRDGELNLLVATAVAEEGLDFPACELVIRFDTFRTLVSYVQSRGRARNQVSKFVILIEKDNTTEMQRYKTFQESEPKLKRVYQSSTSALEKAEAEAEEYEDPRDVARRETYVVPTTGATLTYGSAINLLNSLCTLIRRDEYTPNHQPKYEGIFKCKLTLPGALPLNDNEYVYEGPERHTKKEAKRAVAFLAVKRLHQLGVFDDYLRASRQTRGLVVDDADNRPAPEVNTVPISMDVLVADPWKVGPPWYSHTVSLDGQACMMLVAGSQLPNLEFTHHGTHVMMSFSSVLEFTGPDKDRRMELLNKFTRLGLWWCVMAAPAPTPFATYFIPLQRDGTSIDWENIEESLAFPYGKSDWSGVDETTSEGSLLIMNRYRYGQPLLLKKFRRDLRFSDKPTTKFVPEEFESYAEYFNAVFYNAKYRPITFSEEEESDVILEVVRMKRRDGRVFSLEGTVEQEWVETEDVFFHPLSICKWSPISQSSYRSFYLFTKICQRATDLYRVQSAITSLDLPPLLPIPAISALTIPSANAGFNNQRLETLGDSVLKLSTVVHVYNKYPKLHEGQLDRLKTVSVSNRTLLARAKEVGLERFVSSEPRAKGRRWVFVGHEGTFVPRSYVRRSLQDCMEALLGASFVSGGFPTALQTGTSLGLCFGGATPWEERYSLPEQVNTAPLFTKLQTEIGYTFRNGRLLQQAMTHDSFQSHGAGGTSYQRLEFLGDALVEMVTSNYLYTKFPNASSGQLSNARQHVICNSTLALLGVRKLSLHKYILANNIELSKSIAAHVEQLQECQFEDVVLNNWRYDPPKVLGDVFESLVGAVFVDVSFDYERCSGVVEGLLRDALEIVYPDMPKDPVSKFLMWINKLGCIQAKFDRTRSNPLSPHKDCVSVYVHKQLVAGPVRAPQHHRSVKLLYAKGLAAEEAQRTLQDEENEMYLGRICDCVKKVDDTLQRSVVDVQLSCLRQSQETSTSTSMMRSTTPTTTTVVTPTPTNASLPTLTEVENGEVEVNVDDETEEGFAMKGAILTAEEKWRDGCEIGGGDNDAEGGDEFPSGYDGEDEEDEEEEERDVEMMLRICDDRELPED